MHSLRTWLDRDARAAWLGAYLGATLADEVVGRDTGLRHLPRFWHGVWESLWGPPFTPGTPSEASNDFFRARQRALTAGLHAAGVRIHAGTDTLMPFVAPGSSLHGELAELMGAGIPPERVWQIATRENARALGEPGLGTLAVGAPADLVFLRANPAHGIEALLRIEAVLADGRLYRLMQGGFAPERDAVQTH